MCMNILSVKILHLPIIFSKCCIELMWLHQWGCWMWKWSYTKLALGCTEGMK